MVFRRTVLFALLVGALTGLLLGAIQLWQVIPIIEDAERFEQARASKATGAAPETVQAREHAEHAHAGPAGEWQPAEGTERTAYTLLSNVVTAVGFALVMLAAMVASLRLKAAARFDWRYGLLWGLAGYVVFFGAPALGLPPQLPGAEAGALEFRQLWWVLAAGCTATGLAVAALGKSPWRWAALGLLLVPHLVGAPRLGASPFVDYPPEMAAHLEELARRFIWATAAANALFWLALGSASAWVVRRWFPKHVVA
jgi:cobalt transporter subunit CbtA